ncbi:NFX1-type zinc finger-containing protein 1 [Cyphellophora attinorum]|uniref:NFX1-type zinc finger-containing protein 1 n=1 Tax=Cyphellophora attinorum TaxID=1664694 RepID=A0A0N0NIK5_9EURO|nr:NFX1-type zinc finger-containing protein 1 [Phialophora attinorum]KPI35941.1 NFX1-type zinc finger-containing protein 1 [Phialophora attinorum]
MDSIRAKFSKRVCPEKYDSDNILSLEPQCYNQVAFYDSFDGPQPQHDNDHVQYELITILPTMDEILAAYKRVYQPKKDYGSPNPHSVGMLRHLDLMFRQLRQESIHPIKDICYVAAQMAFVPPSHQPSTSQQVPAGTLPLGENMSLDTAAGRTETFIADVRNPATKDAFDSAVRETYMGNRFFLYEGARVEELQAHERNAINVRLSFNCPEYLRGGRLFKSNRLQNGFMMALLCHNNIKHELEVFYFSIHLRQSTVSMDCRGGNGQKAAILCTLIPESTKDDVLELARYAQNLEPGMEFCLVEFPRLMHHGFYHCLKRLQQLSVVGPRGDVAFRDYVAPSRSPEELSQARLTHALAGTRSIQDVRPPRYARDPGFSFDLSSIFEGRKTSFSLQDLSKVTSLDSEALDFEQDKAFRYCLTNEFAFVQGPPGTGKTYLGLRLAQVLLASRPSKPILVVCLTNHALDNFLSGLIGAGVKDIVRVESGSKEEWTAPLNLRMKARKARNSPRETAAKSMAARKRKQAYTNINDWCCNVSAQLCHVPSLSPSDDVGSAMEGPINKIRTNDMLGSVGGKPRPADPEAAARSLAEDVDSHNEASKITQTVRENVDVRVLSSASIIAMTTTACANRWDVLRRVGVEVVIFEEAAEVMEPHTLCALLPSLQHAISIGDPKQLRPEVSDQCLTLEKCPDHRLDESLFERMVSPVDPSAARLCYEHLGLQRRMHPDIAELSRLTYPFLRDHESTKDHEPTFGINERSFGGIMMFRSAKRLKRISLASMIMNQGDIAVLTPYTGQLAALHQALSLTCHVWLDEQDRENLLNDEQLTGDVGRSREKEAVTMEDMLRITTVDNFQGEEAKVVILSTVRSGGSAGFLSIENRITVACSRARDGFYVIGNSKTLGQVPLWREMISLLGPRRIGPNIITQCGNHPDHSSRVRHPDDFFEIPECPVRCQDILECGHKCDRKCHPKSLHKRGALPCEHACERELKCGHKCTLPCGADCGNCLTPVRQVILPCGHSGAKVCSGGMLTCNAVTGNEKLPCGHIRKILCAEAEKLRGRGRACEACRAKDDGDSSETSNNYMYGEGRVVSGSEDSSLGHSSNSKQTMVDGLDEQAFIEEMLKRRALTGEIISNGAAMQPKTASDGGSDGSKRVNGDENVEDDQRLKETKDNGLDGEILVDVSLVSTKAHDRDKAESQTDSDSKQRLDVEAKHSSKSSMSTAEAFSSENASLRPRSIVGKEGVGEAASCAELELKSEFEQFMMKMRSPASGPKIPT